MKFIRVKVRSLNVDSDDLLQKINEHGLCLRVNIPLPDVYQKKVTDQLVTLTNYEVMGYNQFALNSLSLYNFRVDETTLGMFVASMMTFSIPEYQVEGSLNMNKVLLAENFKLEATVPLRQTVTVIRQVRTEGRKKP